MLVLNKLILNKLLLIKYLMYNKSYNTDLMNLIITIGNMPLNITFNYILY